MLGDGIFIHPPHSTFVSADSRGGVFPDKLGGGDFFFFWGGAISFTRDFPFLFLSLFLFILYALIGARED